MNKAYRIKFPRSFFLLYDFMKELNKDDPLNELVKNGMQMVGPYEELHKCHTQQGYLPGFITVYNCRLGSTLNRHMLI